MSKIALQFDLRSFEHRKRAASIDPVYTLPATSDNSSLQRLAMITSHSPLNAPRSCATSPAVEVRRVQRGLAGHRGHALGLHAARVPCTELARKLSEPVFMARRRAPTTGALTPEYTSSFTRLGASSDALPLARAAGAHDGLDEALRHVAVVRQQVQSVLRQAAAAVAEARVVVVRADALVQAHSANDLGGVEPSGSGAGVGFVEAGRAALRMSRQARTYSPSCHLTAAWHSLAQLGTAIASLPENRTGSDRFGSCRATREDRFPRDA